MDDVLLSVSDFVALTNQTLEYAYPSVSVVGEISEYKIIQGKWVSFKLKDDTAVISCFASVYQLRTPLENGMQAVIVAAPKLNQKGYFTMNVRTAKPIGEGSIKKSFELLVAKLEKEGLFSPERKRLLPRIPQHIAVITSTESAAYADFCRIINERWGGVKVTVAHTQVQGDPAPDQMIRALQYINNLDVLPEVVVIIRGGGSAEDLAAFNDEQLARAIAASRVPTLVGVGHEIDHSLADMVADVRAATPTHAAETIVPDRQEIIRTVHAQTVTAGRLFAQALDHYGGSVQRVLKQMVDTIDGLIDSAERRLALLQAVMIQVDPQTVLQRGYALVRGQQKVGEAIEIETYDHIMKAEITDVTKK